MNHAIRQSFLEFLDTDVSDLSLVEAYRSEPGQSFQMLQASVGDLGIVEVQPMEADQSFQVLLLGAEGFEQVGSGRLLPAQDANRKRAHDLLDAAVPASSARAEDALRHALSLQADHLILFSATAVDEAVAKRIRAWNTDRRTVIDVIGLEGVSNRAVLDRIAADNGGRVKMLARPLRGPDPSVAPATSKP